MFEKKSEFTALRNCLNNFNVKYYSFNFPKVIVKFNGCDILFIILTQYIYIYVFELKTRQRIPNNN